MPVAPLVLRGKAVMWLPGNLAKNTSAQTAAGKLGIKTASTITQADVVCVQDFAAKELTPLFKLKLYLNGGRLAQLEYITTLGETGACITFKAAVRAKGLRVWLSRCFAERNPLRRAEMEAAIMSADSKWSWFVGNHVEFLRKAVGHKTNCKLVGIVSNDEFQNFPRGLANVMTFDGFLGYIRTTDARTTKMLR